MTDNVIEFKPKKQEPLADKTWAETARKNGLDAATIAWLQIRAEEAQLIDPEREYWARRPGSDIWVSFDDLPDAIEEALWDRHKRNLAFPAGFRTRTGFMSLKEWLSSSWAGAASFTAPSCGSMRTRLMLAHVLARSPLR